MASSLLLLAAACGGDDGARPDAGADASLPDAGPGVLDAGPVDANVDADLGPVPPVSGTFEMIFTLVPIEPPPAEMAPVETMVAELYDDPPVALLRWLALATDGTDYPTTAPWSMLFACGAPGCDFPAPTALGRTVADAFEEDANETLPARAEGPTLREALTAERTRVDEIRDVYMVGSLVLPIEPDDMRILPGDNELTISNLGFHWVTRGVGVRRLEGDAVRVISGITASVEPSSAGVDARWGLALSPLTITIGYVETLSILLSSFALPRAIVYDLVGIYDGLVDCTRVAEHLTCTGDWAADPGCDGSAAPVASAFEAACIAMGARDPNVFQEIATLLVGEDTTTVFAGPEGLGCPLALDEGTGLHLAGTSTEPCQATADLRFSGASIGTGDASWYTRNP